MKRRYTMEIKKIINNNIVSSMDKNGTELIVMGKGIGFGKKAGQKINEKDVEKIFRMENADSLEQFKKLLAVLPLEYVQLSNDIISYAKASIGIKLNQNVYLTLMDLINEKTNIQMPDDEAASIALHLVNAEYNSKISETFRMTKMIQEMVNQIETKMPRFKENSMHKDWLVSNLKYMAHRLMKLPAAEVPEDRDFQQVVRKYCGEEYSLVDEINEFLKKEYECSMTDEEKNYLAISIKRTRDTYSY